MGVDEPRIDDRSAQVALVGVGRGGPHRVERSDRRDPPTGEADRRRDGRRVVHGMHGAVVENQSVEVAAAAWGERNVARASARHAIARSAVAG
jgi:hypothetical protein